MARYIANMTPAAQARYAHYKHHSARLTLTARHYDQLVQMLEQGARSTTRSMADWEERYRANGWSGKRYRWGWLGLADSQARTAWLDEVYDYADDRHIDSALKAACREFGRDTDWPASATQEA